MLNINVDFLYRRDAFRRAGGEPRSHLSRCSEQESPTFRFNHFLLKVNIEIEQSLSKKLRKNEAELIYKKTLQKSLRELLKCTLFFLNWFNHFLHFL